MQDEPPPRPRMRSTRVGMLVRRGRPVPVYVVHPAGDPVPDRVPACAPGCRRCTR
jgi:hypothetical protein